MLPLFQLLGVLNTGWVVFTRGKVVHTRVGIPAGCYYTLGSVYAGAVKGNIMGRGSWEHYNFVNIYTSHTHTYIYIYIYIMYTINLYLYNYKIYHKSTQYIYRIYIYIIIILYYGYNMELV